MYKVKQRAESIYLNLNTFYGAIREQAKEQVHSSLQINSDWGFHEINKIKKMEEHFENE